MRIAACVLLLTFASGSVIGGSGTDSPGVTVPAAPPRSHAYIDDDDQRPLAELSFDTPAARSDNLQLRISATGPEVEPISGYRGFSGTNRYTAEELSLMLAGIHDVEIRTRDEGGAVNRGTIRPGRTGTLPERRFVPGQPIDFLARTDRVYLLELIVLSGTQSSGRFVTEVLLNGVPRLQTEYTVHGGVFRIIDVQSVGHDEQLLTDVRWIRPGTARRPAVSEWHRYVSLQEVTPLPPELLDGWKDRDQEGRWVRMHLDVQQHPERLDAWISFLVQQKEFELLEWIALYVPDAFKSHNVGQQLVAANAPQWLRVAVWHQSAALNVGHTLQVSSEIIQYHQPAVVEHWLAQHRSRIDNWQHNVSVLYDQLVADDVPPKDSNALLPPLQPAEVFRLLTPPDDVIEFGDRTRAGAADVYLHQVLRAIDGLIISGRFDQPKMQQVRQLTRHSSVEIRQAALLAFSSLAPRYPRTERFDDIVAMIDDPDQPAVVREAALMGYSFQNHPAALLKVHEVAGSPDHAAWSAAVSRLGDIGESWSVSLLTTVDKSLLTDAQQQILGNALAQIRSRADSEKAAAATFRVLKLAAFARQSGSALADRLADQAKQSARKLSVDDREQLRRMKPLAGGPIWTPGGDEAFRTEFETLRAAALQ